MTEELAERDGLRQTHAFPIAQGVLKVASNSGFDEGLSPPSSSQQAAAVRSLPTRHS